MTRVFFTLTLALSLALFAIGGAVAAPALSPYLTLTGTLERCACVETPHWEVDDYILTNVDTGLLESLAGKEVVVVGQVSTEPSIYMHPMLSVRSIAAKADTPPDKGDDQITLPVILPEPTPVTPAPDDRIGIPEAPEPIPMYGSPNFILFGRLELAGATYSLIQEGPAGSVTTAISGSEVNLAALAGERVALVVEKGATGYRVKAAMALSGDLAPAIGAGTGLIYTAPGEPISIQLRGKTIAIDQPPVLGNGRTLVGLRAIGEGLGARVDWNGTSREATVAQGDREVIVTLGSNRVVIRQPGKADKIILSDIAPVIVNGRTMIPVRVLAESLGLKVGWNEAAFTVTLD
ncbi:MAG TPA: copper amine oxidase N-terminal domain-containing protein [Symbiobacteriaceae bacterium]|nr:copper amine oxidase N-terminal domain-containing protein [Symbiobacteriaceae bacterium]